MRPATEKKLSPAPPETMADDTAPYDVPENLTNIYKKNGSFDQQRKALLEEFRQSETHANLLLKLKVLVESKIQNDPSILLKNKGMMAALMQGEIMSIRNNQQNAGLPKHDLLDIVERDIKEKITDSHHFHSLIKAELHAIKRDAMELCQEEYDKQLDLEQGDPHDETTKTMHSSESREKRPRDLNRRREAASSPHRDSMQLGLSNRVSKPSTISSRIDSTHLASRKFTPKPHEDDQNSFGSQRLMY